MRADPSRDFDLGEQPDEKSQVLAPANEERRAEPAHGECVGDSQSVEQDGAIALAYRLGSQAPAGGVARTFCDGERRAASFEPLGNLRCRALRARPVAWRLQSAAIGRKPNF